jgi:AraC-like DNA-binding protein/quercetin dioxygenase-like cupin family protein
LETRVKSWGALLPQVAEEKVRVISHPNLRSVAAHSHLFFELTYILRGSVEHTVDGKVNRLSAGDYFLVDYGSVHAYRTAKGESFENLDCLFLPELLDPSLKGRESLSELFEHYLLNFNLQVLSQNPAQMVFHDEDGSILKLLRCIGREEEGRAAGYTEMIRCYLIEILLLTLRRLENATAASGAQKVSSYLCAWVSKHYMDEVSVTELAAQMNYSVPYVSRRFKEEMGMTFVRYLQDYRVKQAARLLLAGKTPVSQVAEQVGYRDVKFFSRVFKTYTGHSPAAFRRMGKMQ